MKIGKISGFGTLTSYGKWYGADTLYKTNRLYYVHSGKATYIEGGELKIIEEGKIYFIPETDDFTPFASDETPFVHSYVDFTLISPIKCKEILSVPFCEGVDDELMLAIRLILLACAKREELRSDRTSSRESFVKMFEEAVAYTVSRISEAHGADFVSDGVVARAISIMNGRMNENLSVRDIAEAVYMSEDGFIRRFSRVMGATPYAYLKKLRLVTAESMIFDGEAVADVAISVGYSDASALLHAISVERKKSTF